MSAEPHKDEGAIATENLICVSVLSYITKNM